MPNDQFGNDYGETCLPEYDSAASFHKGRYSWSLHHIPGGRGLDVGCGIGYGSQILLDRCLSYVGFDKYPSRKQRADFEFKNDRAEFLTLSANDIFPFESESFKSAVCFEAIEHIENDWQCVREIARCLDDDGVFVCSTPINKGQQKGHFHIREYTVQQFQEMINHAFSEVSYWGQNHGEDFKENAFEQIYILCVAKKPIRKNESSRISPQDTNAVS